MAIPQSTRRIRKRGISIVVRTGADGAKTYGAHVRVKGFDPVWKTWPSEADCIAWATETRDKLKEERREGKGRRDLSKLTLAQLNAGYLADPAVKGHHVAKYGVQLKRALTWWDDHYGDTALLEFGVLQMHEGRDALMAEIVRGGGTRSAAAVKGMISPQRSAWNWGRSTGLIATGRVWPPGLMPSEARGRTRYLTDEERVALLAAAQKASPVLYAAIVIAIATGVRKGELLRLMWKDIDFERSRIQVLITKNGDPRAVYLPPVAAQALKTLKAGPVVSATHVFAGPAGKALTWNQLDKLWRPVRTAIGLKDFRWHDLRHTAASYLAQAGASLTEIGAVLGHRSPSVTARYSHMVQGAPVTGHDKLNSKLQGQP